MKKNIISSVTLILLVMCTTAVQAENFYQVSLLRAAPGHMPELIDLVKARKLKLKGEMLIMRHSQGDHWDLMLLSPGSERLEKPVSYQEKADFQHDFLVTSSIDWNSLEKKSLGANLFHIEMFQSAMGKYADLLEQRKMENNYLVATQRDANLIFETFFGSDVDLFTLGIYPDMQAFAAEPELTDETFEKAAKVAGFASRSDIGFYLRRFLVAHQDTLATQID